MTSVNVKTSFGEISGYLDSHPLSDVSTASLAPGSCAPVAKWLGVPYAQSQRWKKPVSPKSWTTPLETKEFGSMFPQAPSGTDAIYGGGKAGVFRREWVKQSEDSHTVNVFAPGDMTPGEKLPVLVWIYGGSLNNGSADRFLYDPTEWIRRQATEKGERFIVVTGNYRVNIFGFFSGPDVLADSEDGLSGNYGLYDAVKIFEWVHENADAFGFDRSRVTAFGESAGAFIVASLLVSRKRLFTRAILQSGAPGTMQIRPLEKAYPAYSNILNFYGAGAATPTARMNALRALPAAELLKGHTEAHAFGGVGLTIETGPNAIWSEPTIDVLQRGEWDEWIKEVIIGTNEDEGSMFAFMMQPLLKPEGFSAYISKFPSIIKDAYAAAYPPSFFDTISPTDYLNAPASKVIADQLFVAPARRLAEALSIKPNAKTGERTKVYLYRCRETVDRLITDKLNLGSMHSIDIPLIFNVSPLWEEGGREAATAQAMGSRWAHFAATGIPHPEWKQYSSADPSWLAFNAGGKAEMEKLSV